MIYFHIPFCKQACHYCDFHFSTSLKYKEDLLQGMLREIELRASYLENTPITSIYFGGGTPSLLNAGEINRLVEKVSTHFDISSSAEITLEANPDDLNREKLIDLRHTPINRLSIGVQSFFQEDLLWMNRAHNAEEADSSIKRAQDQGYENMTCDLIYGYPLLSDEKWKSNMQQLIQLQVPHISSYSMTVESKTALDHQIRKGTSAPMNEEQSARQMLQLIDTLQRAGYEQYEISNFAHSGQYAKHNSNYWRGVHYLGIGPSAHSFNGHSRSWNLANNAKYIAGIQSNKLALETEELSTMDRFNEYVMTRLRTKWGIDETQIKTGFGETYLEQLALNITPYVQHGEVLRSEEGVYTLSTSGKLLADQIAADLFLLTD
ncbi:MAG: radical SAM family heme chaperone HemW [Sphingobacterium sp.]